MDIKKFIIDTLEKENGYSEIQSNTNEYMKIYNYLRSGQDAIKGYEVYDGKVIDYDHTIYRDVVNKITFSFYVPNTSHFHEHDSIVMERQTDAEFYADVLNGYEKHDKISKHYKDIYNGGGVGE